MLLRFLILISFFGITFELPNGVEIEVSPSKSAYSDWFEIFLKSSSVVPLLRTKEKVYYIGKYFRANFLQAHLFCKIMQMNLVTISTKEENEEIKTILKDNDIIGEFWSSGTKMIDGNSWIWMSTAKPVENICWGPGQPDNKNDHCILTIKTYKDFIWNDRNCNCRFFFICEKHLEETVLYISKKKEPTIRKYYRNYFD